MNPAGNAIRFAACVATMAVAFSNIFLVSLFPGLFQLELVLLDIQWLLLICLSIWCATIFVLSLSMENLPLIGLLLIAILKYFCNSKAWPVLNITTLLTGVLLGKGIAWVLNVGSPKKIRPNSVLMNFLFGIFACLAFFSTWHWRINGNLYEFPRLKGIWFNPNIYGSLMGAGLVPVIGILVYRRKHMGLWTSRQNSFLLLFAAIMLLGLIFS